MKNAQPVSKYLSQSRFSKIEILLLVFIVISALLSIFNLWFSPLLLISTALYIFLRAPRVTDSEYEHMLYQLFYNNPIKYRFDEEYEAILLFIFHPKVEQRKIGDYTHASYDMNADPIIYGSDKVWRSSEYHVYNMHFTERECRIYTLRANLLDWTMSEHTYIFPYSCNVTTEKKTVSWHGEQMTLCSLCFNGEVSVPVDDRSMDYPEILKHFNT